MTKILEFPGSKLETVTWGTALQSIIDNASDATKNTIIRNVLIVSEGEQDYSFGLLNGDDVRSMLGTIECVKNYLVYALQSASTYE